MSNQPYGQAVEALRADDWLIVTDEPDWEPVLQKMASGETQKAARGDQVVGPTPGGLTRAERLGPQTSALHRPASGGPPVPGRPPKIVGSRERPKQLAGARAAGASGPAPGKRPATNDAESVDDFAKE